MRIGIVGGGNMGCVIATKFSQKNKVTLYTNLFDKAALYKKNMKVYSEDTNNYFEAKIDCITTSLEELCDKSDYIFITFPSFLFEQLARDIYPYLKENHHLFFIPGSGGAELFFKDALSKNVTITGLQRVHSVARIIDFGQLTKESGIRKELYVASVPNSYNKEAARIIEYLYDIKTNMLDNYLNITLINSNPILHTSRLYTIFCDYENVKEYDSLPLFYEDWSINSSELLIKMDNELFGIISSIRKDGLLINQVKPLLEHYESTNTLELTNKIKSINSLKGLTTPSLRLENGKFSPDFSSRYFTADFPFGLDILLSFADFFDIYSPNLLRVSKWYHQVTKTPSFFDLYTYFKNKNELIDFYK